MIGICGTPLGRERPEDLVSLHDAHPEPSNSCSFARARSACAPARGLTPPALAITLIFRSTISGKEITDVVDEVAGVSGLRVAPVLLVEDRHRHLGEVVQDEVIDRTRTHLKGRRLGPVAPEGLSTGDPDHGITPSLSLTHFPSR